MAKNYESESKNSRNYTGTSDKNSYGNEMNHAGNAKNSRHINWLTADQEGHFPLLIQSISVFF